MAAIPIRIRKLIGAVALVALVIVWSLLAMALAQFVALRSSPVIKNRKTSPSPEVGLVAAVLDAPVDL